MMKFEETQKFLEKLVDMVRFLLPLYVEEGKTSLTVAIGCTGGKHRSVTLANKLGEALERYHVNLIYRMWQGEDNTFCLEGNGCGCLKM